MNEIYVVEDREEDTIRIVEDTDDISGHEIEIYEALTIEEAKAFAQDYQQKRIQKLIGNLFELGTAPVFYFVTTMFINDYKYKHVCKQGFFSTKEKAEKFLIDNWHMLHECWNNYGVIEEIKMGVAESSCRDIKQWWFMDKTSHEQKLSEELMPANRPKCTEIDGRAIMFAF